MCRCRARSLGPAGDVPGTHQLNRYSVVPREERPTWEDVTYVEFDVARGDVVATPKNPLGRAALSSDEP
jgi:hypothetical protein